MKSPPTSPSPSQVRINRKYVRRLKAQEDRNILQQSSSSNKSFEDELDEYSSKRLLMEQPCSSTAVQMSFKSPAKSPNSIISIPDDDSEIEEGEIVEREVSECVDLIEESFNALKQSRKITDLSPTKSPLFFEDKREDKNKKELPPPLYNPIGSPSNSDDVILIDSPHKSVVNTSNTDDSIIFVCEESTVPKPLQKPKVLSSPALNELMKLSGVRLTPLSRDKESKTKRRERVQNYFNKKKMEYARKEVEKTVRGNTKDTQQPTTSTASVSAAAAGPSSSSKLFNEKKKRIILIDGSNVAITHAKSKLGKEYDEKSPKAFSVEGLSIALRYFQDQGFQVKAVIPEYRLKEKKSSNAKLLHELEDEGLLIPTPSKAYDDRILLESASRLNAAVVSNDYFRDFKSNENFIDVLNNRHIRYNWAFDEFVLTEDSYGRNGPLLKDILYINT